MFSRSHSFAHYPELVTLDEGVNVDGQVQRSHHSTNPSVNHPFCFSVIHEQDPEIFKLLHLGQNLVYE